MSTALNTNDKGNPGTVMCRIARSGFRVHSKDSFSKEPGRLLMLAVNVQNFGDVVVLHCEGRIVAGDTTLQRTVSSLKDAGTLVLDLANVDAVDAGGLGVLLDLQAWAHSRHIQLKLANATNSVRRVLELTQLDRVFKICSERELFRLLRRATRIASRVNRETLRTNKGFDIPMQKTGT